MNSYIYKRQVVAKMSKQFWKTIALVVTAIFTSLLLVVGQALLASAAAPRQQIIAQGTSIEQFKDVKETDYYYKALKEGFENYGCVVGQRDGTFRADRPLQSAELVGILNACMDRVGELAAAATPMSEDLGPMQELLREIATEVNSMQR